MVMGMTLYSLSMEAVKYKQILVVDDEQIDRHMMSIFLGEEYKLSFATTYDAACECLNNEVYDLIITDMHIGFDRDGSQVLAFAKSSELNHKIPVIAYSASRSGFNKQESQELGFDGYLVKPVLKDEFQKFIRSILK